MAKGTLVFIFTLALLASFLVGFNFGRKIGLNQSLSSSQPTPSKIPISIPLPTVTSRAYLDLSTTPKATISAKTGTSTFTDKKCGFTFSYPGSYLNQKSVNEQSVILTDPNDPNQAIATACTTAIPRPTISADKIEPITLDGVAALLYHDQNPDGSFRDEVIVKNPKNGLEILIAGFGPTFKQILNSFKFIQ